MFIYYVLFPFKLKEYEKKKTIHISGHRTFIFIRMIPNLTDQFINVKIVKIFAIDLISR